jgi:hypothetical protein
VFSEKHLAALFGRFDMFVCTLVSRFFGRFKQFERLSNTFLACFGIESFGCPIPGDGFGFPEPSVCGGWNRSLSSCREMIGERVDCGAGLGWHSDHFIVSHWA